MEASLRTRVMRPLSPNIHLLLLTGSQHHRAAALFTPRMQVTSRHRCMPPLTTTCLLHYIVIRCCLPFQHIPMAPDSDGCLMNACSFHASPAASLQRARHASRASTSSLSLKSIVELAIREAHKLPDPDTDPAIREARAGLAEATQDGSFKVPRRRLQSPASHTCNAHAQRCVLASVWRGVWRRCSPSRCGSLAAPPLR